MTAGVVVRVAGADDVAAWLADEGDRRTTWLATLAGEPAGMASLFEHRRMPRPDRPDSRWGYVSNMFVRDRGVGAALLAAIVTAAEEGGYVRLVTAPSEEALRFYARAGFVVPGGDDRLLVRPAGPQAAGPA